MLEFPELAFDAAAHVYTHRPTGQRLQNVTGAMRKMGMGFTGFAPNEALWRGQWVHECVSLYVRGDLDEEAAEAQHPEWWGYMRGFFAFLRDTGAKPKHTEVRLYDLDWLLAGTADLPGIFLGGERGGVEIKTGDHTDVHVQCGAYDHMWRVRVSNLPLKWWRCLKLNADGSYDAKLFAEPLDVQGGWELMTCALRILIHLRNHGKEKT